MMNENSPICARLMPDLDRRARALAGEERPPRPRATILPTTTIAVRATTARPVLGDQRRVDQHADRRRRRSPRRRRAPAARAPRPRCRRPTRRSARRRRTRRGRPSSRRSRRGTRSRRQIPIAGDRGRLGPTQADDHAHGARHDQQHAAHQHHRQKGRQARRPSSSAPVAESSAPVDSAVNTAMRKMAIEVLDDQHAEHDVGERGRARPARRTP